MKGYTSIDELMGSHPQAVRESPLPSVRRSSAPLRRYREGCGPKTLGAFSLDSIASGLNTDTKTLLLIGGGGILAGYLLNDVIQSARKTVKGVKRAISGAHRKARTPLLSIPGVDITPMKIALIAAVLGGYWYYKHEHSQALPQEPQA